MRRPLFEPASRAAVLLALALGAAGPLARGAEPSTGESPREALGVSAGVFEFTDDTYREAELGLQYRLGRRLGAFQPMAGGMVTSAGAFHLYAGLALEIPASPRLLLRLSLAPGYYDQGGSGKDLGLALEFRTGLEVAWRLRGGWRLGIEAYHLSNANLGSINPGNGSILVALTVPLGRARAPQ